MPGSKTIVSVYGFEPFRIGGGETFIRELSLLLGRRGWKNVVCFLTEPTPQVREFLSLPNVTIEVIPDVWQLKWQPTRDLARILRRYRPEILHLQFTGFVSPYPWLARFYGAKRVLFTDQASKPEGFVPRRASLFKRVATRIINWPLDRVTCISDYVLRCWTTLDVLQSERFTRIYNHVDFTRCQPDGSAFRKTLTIPDSRQIIVQVSWMIPDKGFDDLLAAARLVIARNPEAYFVMVGEGADRQRYIRETKELGLQDHITWTGILPDPLKMGVFSAADVVCQVSRWEEGFGYVIAEAMASGKPLVGTRVGAIPELVHHGKTGFLVDRRDPPAIAERILELLADRDLRCRMGQAGREFAFRNFDANVNIAEFLKLYGI
uniref:Glycosyl transferase, group 1 n=1 Tax=Solibacter usitatus (strain Ellin6076) TaxID=234267 RepID=Q029D9_SOLUE